MYISHDVIFDETVFPFTKLHANAVAQLHAEINLLPTYLLPSTFPFGSTTIQRTDLVNDSSNEILPNNGLSEVLSHAATQDKTGAGIDGDLPAPRTGTPGVSTPESAPAALGASSSWPDDTPLQSTPARRVPDRILALPRHLLPGLHVLCLGARTRVRHLPRRQLILWVPRNLNRPPRLGTRLRAPPDRIRCGSGAYGPCP